MIWGGRRDGGRAFCTIGVDEACFSSGGINAPLASSCQCGLAPGDRTHQRTASRCGQRAKLPGAGWAGLPLPMAAPNPIVPPLATTNTEPGRGHNLRYPATHTLVMRNLWQRYLPEPGMNTITASTSKFGFSEANMTICSPRH